jgi:XTP/dITP diphosphohydrolase
MTPAQAYVIATRSTHKRSEIQQILAHAAGSLLTLDDAGVPISADEDAIEAFDTFHENAIAKARYFLAMTGKPVIADDSGIMLDALDGQPGVRSRRFSGRTDLTGDALDRANNDLVAATLAQFPEHERSAHYMCVAALAFPDGSTFAALGSCSGMFLLEPRGTGGFGYDPHFLVPHLRRTFGELSAVEKHSVSHRARAFRALAPMLR